MILNRKVIFNVLLEYRQFYFIVGRLASNSQIIYDDKLMHNTKFKGKISVTNKKLLGDKQIIATEWERASSVIKRLNTEYLYQFGPIQTTSKSKLPDFSKTSADEIIQHQTRIPIIEPSVEICNEQQKNYLDSILTFPLVNKCVHPTTKVNELNILRKQLKFLCNNSRVPSVSSILQNTMPNERKEILERWKQNMISQLGQEGFEKYQADTLANGVSLHHSICTYLASTPESELHIKEENQGHWNSLKFVLPKINDVKLIEEFVEHPFLCYKGIVDCFAKYKDDLVVIDWKTSKKSKANIKNTYDDPLQIAAYVGALNFDPKYQYLARKGVIIIAYENGMPATDHFMDEATLKHYWNEWLQRLKQFWEMRISEEEKI